MKKKMAWMCQNLRFRTFPVKPFPSTLLRIGAKAPTGTLALIRSLTVFPVPDSSTVGATTNINYKLNKSVHGENEEYSQLKLLPPPDKLLKDPELVEPEDPELVDGLEEEEELDGVPEELDDELPPLTLDNIGALAKTGIRAPTRRLKLFPCPWTITSDPSAKNVLVSSTLKTLNHFLK